MGIHANAKLGPAGRRMLVRLIREGSTERQAAACLSVAPATAHRWSVRERDEGRPHLGVATVGPVAYRVYRTLRKWLQVEASGDHVDRDGCRAARLLTPLVGVGRADVEVEIDGGARGTRDGQLELSRGRSVGRPDIEAPSAAACRE